MAAQSAFRDDILKGKVVLVSGGGSGIGLGICTALGQHGASVVMCGRRQNVLDEACAGLQAQGIQALGLGGCDVRDPEKCKDVVQKTIERFGRLDILVNNAAGNFTVPMEGLTPNGFQTVIGIDLLGSFNMAKAAFPHLKASGDAVIVNISATLHYKAMPFQMHASAAKAAIDVMTNNMGVEWGEYGIRAVAIAPGPIAGTVGGPTGRVFGKLIGSQLNERETLLRAVPIGRYGTVQDIANAVLFVCSSAGNYVNATQIVVDGGQWHMASDMYHKAKDLIAANSSKERKTHKGGVAKL